MSTTLEDVLYGAYDIPENAPAEVKSDSPEYYKHPKGVYVGVISTLTYKYVNAENKKCNHDDIGAVAIRAILKILLKNVDGEQILGNDLVIPDNRTAPELYFPIMISLKREDQWRAERMFDGWSVDGIEDSQIVKDKLVRYKKFPLYYGLNVKLVINHGEKKGSPYVESIALLNYPREDVEHVKEVVKAVDDKMAAEIDARKAQQSNDAPAPVPDKSIDDILGMGSAQADVGEFGTDDLPF